MRHRTLSLALPCLLLFLGLSGPAFGQSTADKVKSAIDASLGEYLSEVFPPNSCEENDSGHNYAGDFNITRTAEVDGTLRVWGRAKVTFRNRRTGGDTVVDYYAECVRSGDAVEVTRLRWRRGSCMRYEALLGN